MCLNLGTGAMLAGKYQGFSIKYKEGGGVAEFGLRRGSRKAVSWKQDRGFESHLLRLLTSRVLRQLADRPHPTSTSSVQAL